MLNGSSQYVTYPDSDDWYFGTGDFTIDCWVKHNSLSGRQEYVTQDDGATSFFYAGRNQTGPLEFKFQIAGVIKGDYYANIEPFMPALDVWYHIAFVRDGATAHIFINGVSQAYSSGTPFAANDVGNIAGDLHIGSWAGGALVNGSIAEVRITKGTALWTSDFDVCTVSDPVDPVFSAPSVADSNTVLLAHMDGSAKDYSGNHHVPTLVGDPTFRYKDPLQGSLSLNGVSDYVSFPDSSDWKLAATNTEEWTVDFWMRTKSVNVGTECIVSHGVDHANSWNIFHQSVPRLVFSVRNAGGDVIFMTTSGTPDAVVPGVGIEDNDWHHVALVKVGQDYAFYIDGKRASYLQDASTKDTTGLLKLGRSSDNSLYMDGNLAGFRIVKSNIFNAVPTSARGVITVPTLAPTTDKFDVPTVPAATNTFDLPTSSFDFTVPGKIERGIELNGTSEYLRCDSIIEQIQNDKVGTIAIWLNLDIKSVSRVQIWQFMDQGADEAFIELDVHDDGQLQMDVKSTPTGRTLALMCETGQIVNRNTWYHVVVVMDGVYPKFYVDGKLINTRVAAGVGPYSNWFGAFNWSAAPEGFLGVFRSPTTGLYNRWWPGELCDFRVYRYALKAEEVDALWNEGEGTHDVPTVNTTTYLTPQSTSGIHDSYFSGNAPDANQNTSVDMWARNSSPSIHRSVVRPLGLNTIDKSVRAIAGALHLVAISTYAATNEQDVRIQKMSRNWIVDEVTHNSYVTGKAWTTAGAQRLGDDRVGTLLGTTGHIVHGITFPTNITVVYNKKGVDQLTKLLNRNEADNFGMLMTNSHEIFNTCTEFNTSKVTVESKRPFYEVVYKTIYQRVGKVRAKVID